MSNFYPKNLVTAQPQDKKVGAELLPDMTFLNSGALGREE
jgi:hypothetical protein